MKKKMEFSKKLAVAVSLLFFLTAIFSLIMWAFWDKTIPNEILNAVATPFGVVVSGYYIKAGAENYQKIKIEGECNNE